MIETVIPESMQIALERMGQILSNIHLAHLEYNDLARNNKLPEIEIKVESKPETSMHVMD